MAVERPNAFVFKGAPQTLIGPELKAGEKAPAFQAVGNDLNPVQSTAFTGKVRIINSVPSLDTGICSAQTRRFNQEAANLGDNVVVLTVSMDLPFAQKRWCGAEGIDRVITLSDHKDAAFSLAYGTHIGAFRLCSRAVFVVDSTDTIVHVQYMPAGAQEPNYEAAIEAARAAK